MKIQIKSNEISKYRSMFAAKQKYICPICKKSIAAGLVALDHSHDGKEPDGGMIRGTLCNTCNRSEGRARRGAETMAKSNHMVKTNYIQWLKNLIIYLEFSMSNPSNIYHPSWDIQKNKQKPKKRKRKIKL